MANNSNDKNMFGVFLSVVWSIFLWLLWAALAMTAFASGKLAGWIKSALTK